MNNPTVCEVSVSEKYFSIREDKKSICSIRILEAPPLLLLDVNEDGTHELCIVFDGGAKIMIEGDKELEDVRDSLMNLGLPHWTPARWVKLTNTPDPMGVIDSL